MCRQLLPKWKLTYLTVNVLKITNVTNWIRNQWLLKIQLPAPKLVCNLPKKIFRIIVHWKSDRVFSDGNLVCHPESCEREGCNTKTQAGRGAGCGREGMWFGILGMSWVSLPPVTLAPCVELAAHRRGTRCHARLPRATRSRVHHCQISNFERSHFKILLCCEN